MPIQGTAADLIKIAMISIQKKLVENNLDSKMLLQVHDELVFDLNPEEENKARSIIEKEMVDAIKFDCPLEVKIGIGDNWLEAH